MVAARRRRGSGSEWSQQRRRAGRSREPMRLLGSSQVLSHGE